MSKIDVDKLNSKFDDFISERDWDKLHAPKNLEWLWLLNVLNLSRYFNGCRKTSLNK
jgi:hypothetical protein